jgi:hypothetical protein
VYSIMGDTPKAARKIQEIKGSYGGGSWGGQDMARERDRAGAGAGPGAGGTGRGRDRARAPVISGSNISSN